MSFELMKVGASYPLTGIKPYGIFNRFVHQPSEIYMESGFIDPLSTYAYNPVAYTPGSLKVVKDLTSWNGSIFFKEKLKIQDAHTCPTQEYSLNGLKVVDSFVMESQSLGCSSKSSSVTMTDPRGSHQVCYYTFHPEFPGSLIGFIPGISINTSLANGDFIMHDNEKLMKLAKGTINKSCVTVEGLRETFPNPVDPDGPKLYCNYGLFGKKFCQTQIPPSLFTGKMKLFIQAIYGSNTATYNFESSGIGWPPVYNLLLGTTAEEEKWSEVPSRKPIRADGKEHVLVTDHKFNYYVFQPAGSFNILEPSSSGRMLQKYLQKNSGTLSSTELRTLEAYLLSTCKHTKWITVSNNSAFLDAMAGGFPLDHNWKTNWSGKEWSRVVFQKRIPDSYDTRLQKISLQQDVTVLNDSFSEEMARKIDSFRKFKQQETYNSQVAAIIKSSNPFQTPEIEPAWLPNTVRKVFFPKEGHLESRFTDGVFPEEIFCPIGDWESGSWKYEFVAPIADYPLHPNPIQSVKEEAEALQKEWGGLCYSRDFYFSLKEAFIPTLSEDGPYEINTRWQSDKMFVFDPVFNLYTWFDTSDGDPEKPKKNVEGIAPVYCWYSPKDKLIKVEYINISNPPWQQESFDSGTPCGPGNFQTISKTWQPGSPFAGFIINDSKAACDSHGGFIHYEMNGDFPVGVPDTWKSLNSQYFGCQDTADLTVTWGGIRGWNRHWQRIHWSNGTIKSNTKNGISNLMTYLTIPRLDCEGAYAGLVQSKNGTETNSSSLVKVAVHQELYGCSNTGYTNMPVNLADPEVHTPVFYTCGGLFIGVFIQDPPRLFGPQPGNFSSFPLREYKPSGKDPLIYSGPMSPGDTLSGGCLADPWILETWIPIESHTTVNPFLIKRGFGLFFGKTGNNYTLYDVSSSDPEQEVLNTGYFTDFCKYHTSLWPYADSFFSNSSIQSTQGIIRTKTNKNVNKLFPEELKIPINNQCFVGSV